jgi:nitrous oxidase accessory protein NosD
MNVARYVRHIGSVIGGVILLGSLLGAQVASAATYYVATTGNDANPGTDAAPFRTLAKGVKGLKPGDTLYIKSGTYAEALINNIPGGTSWSSPVTVAAAPGQTVTLRPPAGSVNVLRFAHAARKYIVVDGLILDGINVGYDVVKITFSSSGGASHHIRIKNSELKNAQITKPNADQSKPHGQGILITPGSDYNELINLKVHDNGASDFDHGFYISSSYNLIERSEFYRNAGWGGKLYAQGYSNKVNNNIFRNNKMYQNARVGNRGAGIVVSSGKGNLIYNNLVWGNQGGIQIDFGVADAKVYNNTVYANAKWGILIGSGSQGAKISNNIVYGNSGPAISNQGSGTLLSDNLLNVDPKFVNATSKDFRLQGGSLAINTGKTLSEVPKDYAGVSRPQGSSHDIGGYEYTGSTGSALVTAPMNLRIVDSQ